MPENKTGWLVELRGTAPSWAVVNPNDYDEHWVTDSTKAIRFAREVDAKAFIAWHGWTEAFASEHIWDDGKVDDIARRLSTPSYWMSGSRDGHEGENDAPYEAAAEIIRLRDALATATERVAVLCEKAVCERYEQGTSERRAWNEATIDLAKMVRAALARPLVDSTS